MFRSGDFKKFLRTAIQFVQGLTEHVRALRGFCRETHSLLVVHVRWRRAIHADLHLRPRFGTHCAATSRTVPVTGTSLALVPNAAILRLSYLKWLGRVVLIPDACTRLCLPRNTPF